ncbi:MAG: glycoside hydrolase family 3 C-terminal domain-containing protein [Salinivirgaceae bacterium]
MLKKNIFFAISLLCANISLQAQYQYPFQNPDMAVEERIDNLLSLMTLDEKVTCLSTDPSVPRLGVIGTKHVEGLHGLAQGGPSNWGQRNPQATTIFPQAIGLAESWDTTIIRQVASIEGYESRYMFQSKYNRGGLVVRAPNADIGRDIRWGRNEECFGEDAWFNAQMVTQFVKGLQGDNPNYWLTASLMKHFLANSNENGRDSTSSNFNERLFREYYSYPFYKGITEGGSRAFMASYNSYNQIPMTVHPVLKEITVNEWGQNGIICTDGGAYRMLVNSHHYYPDLNKAAEGCIKAGINQFLDNYREGVEGALTNGYLNEADLDAVLRGVFRVMIKLGQLDPYDRVPYKSIGVADTIDPWLTQKHKQVALEATRKSIVLLKNQNRMLPLQKANIKTMALIGPLADTVMLDWYSGTPPYRITPLQGIKNGAGNEINVTYAKDNSFNRAVELAQQADVVVVVVGNNPTGGAGWALCPVPSDGKEGADRKSIELEQEQLIQQVFKANKNLVVVLQSNFPFAINWTQAYVPAILHMAHASQETGNALADVLFGNYNPAGRLVQTWPTDMEHLSEMMDYDITHGRTYMYSTYKPLYAFGFGLSYTDFSYANLKVSTNKLHANETVEVSVDVTNTGNWSGDEVVQLYVSHQKSKVARPNIELKGFCRTFIEKGATKTIVLTVKAADLAYWDSALKKFVVEPDELKLMVGPSSDKIVWSKTIKVVE